MKKYIKTIEDLLALKDTETKMYAEGVNGYYQFKHGILCFFHGDSSVEIFSDFGLGKGYRDRYFYVKKTC